MLPDPETCESALQSPRGTAVAAAVIGAGPAGLMAAEALAAGGIAVHVFERMPSAGRKFLMAGKGGLNITHSEPFDAFIARYGTRREQIRHALSRFDADALRAWAGELGVSTFVGTSGRVFPDEMKAAPLLRAWLHRLRGAGVQFHMRHRWLGWDDIGRLRFDTARGEHAIAANVTVLALGGGSWAKLGSDGTWTPLLSAAGIDVAPLRPANCGFSVHWSAHLHTRFAGAPVKNVRAWTGSAAPVAGEFVVTDYGVEGGAVYALAAALRDAREADGRATLFVDLAPQLDERVLGDRLAQPRNGRSLANVLRTRAGIDGVKAALLRECAGTALAAGGAGLAAAIKRLAIDIGAPRPLDEAISSAGGARFEALDEALMSRTRPGVFCAGEMLDWEAPTGGYLLTACMATGRVAGEGALAWLRAAGGDCRGA